MADKNLKYFMRPEAKEERTVLVPAPPTITDENGKPVDMEIRLLSTDVINKINDSYTTRKMALDKKNKPIISNGNVVYIEKRDSEKAMRHIIVEALKFPDLKDPELMKFFDCSKFVDMPSKVFPTLDEYSYVSRIVMTTLGIFDDEPADDEESDDNETEVESAKN